MTHWPFPGLEPGAYQLILADPATEFRTHSEKGQGKSASQHYRVQTLEEICAWPVGHLADPRGCVLIMWATWPLVSRGDHVKIIRAWGFEPSSGGAWGKVTRNALPAFGTGYVLRDACEPYITAKYKRLPANLTKSERNLILGPLREHSRKPPEMHEMLERLAPGARKAELFGRQPRSGWDVFGDEVGKFGEAA